MEDGLRAKPFRDFWAGLFGEGHYDMCSGMRIFVSLGAGVWPGWKIVVSALRKGALPGYSRRADRIPLTIVNAYDKDSIHEFYEKTDVIFPVLCRQRVGAG